LGTPVPGVRAVEFSQDLVAEGSVLRVPDRGRAARTPGAHRVAGQRAHREARVVHLGTPGSRASRRAARGRTRSAARGSIAKAASSKSAGIDSSSSHSLASARSFRLSGVVVTGGGAGGTRVGAS